MGTCHPAPLRSNLGYLGRQARTAAIAKLQREQAAGKLSSFRFVALNGMEMRHPFEAYIRLWEALNGHRVKKSEEEAAAGLERYFTSPTLNRDNDSGCSCTPIRSPAYVTYGHTQHFKCERRSRNRVAHPYNVYGDVRQLKH